MALPVRSPFFNRSSNRPLAADHRRRKAAVGKFGRSPTTSRVLGRAVLEALEYRRLLSGYALSVLTTGVTPNGGVIADSVGDLYGVTSSGGSNGDGTLFELSAGSTAVTTLATFNGKNGSFPNGGLLMNTAGNLYGTTSQAGANAAGTVFELGKGSSVITTLATFNGVNGSSPTELTEDSAGNLYGTTSGGGAHMDGTAFEVVKGSSIITTLVAFNGVSGTIPTIPSAGLIADPAGNLYGINGTGGVDQDGSVLKLAKGSSTFTVLASFNKTDGQNPSGGLTIDSDGNLYGTTSAGGAHSDGTAFEVVKASGIITILANLSSFTSDFQSLLLDSAGNLFGASTSPGGVYGDGTAFEVAKGSGVMTTLASFDAPNAEDFFPQGELCIDAAGNIFGDAIFSDNAGASHGELFVLSPGTTLPPAQLAFTTQPSIAGAGATLGSPVVILGTPGALVAVSVEDANGALEAADASMVTLSIASGPPGATLSGTLTQMAADGVATFDDLSLSDIGAYTLTATDGTLKSATSAAFPIETPQILSSVYANYVLPSLDYSLDGGVVMDSAGNLYGTADQDGANGAGSIYELAKGSGAVTTLASFNDINSGYGGGIGSLLIDSAGNLYGTTPSGGAAGDGAVFELAKGSSVIATLATFNGNNGSSPNDGVILNFAGNLYGATSGGGANNDGTVFEIAQGSGVITTLASAGALDSPTSGVVIDSAGNLYGAASSGGANGVGAIFELASGSNSLTVLASFNTSDGAVPNGLAIDADGNLYGTAMAGGNPDSAGTVFELAKGSNSIATLASFYGTNGSKPQSTLLVDVAGDLFGTTASGGAYGNGTAFEIVNGSGVITTLANFNVTNVAFGDSETPDGALRMDAAGNIYGALEDVGGGAGSLFELSPATDLPPAQLAFTVPPIATVAGALLEPTDIVTSGTAANPVAIRASTVTVSVEDSADAVETMDNSLVTLSIASGPGDVTLSGTASVMAVNGVATFANLSLDRAGTYTLTATDGTLKSATSADFDVEPMQLTGHDTFSVLTNLATTSPANAGIVMDPAGNLYGTAIDGGGLVYEIAKGSSVVTTLVSFNKTNGEIPGGLIMDAAGNLYGTTSEGGADNDGTVFELSSGSSIITTLATFDGTNGDEPSGFLTADSAGNLYGTTLYGGPNGAAPGDGTVFELAQGSGVITTLVDFSSVGSYSGLIADPVGNLYSIGDSGPAQVVVELGKGSSTFTVLASFGDNAYLNAGLVTMDSAGNLYGTTLYGGANNDGSVFELAKGSSVINTLAGFNSMDFNRSVSALLIDSAGDVFGTTSGDGDANGDGTAFEVVKGSGAITTSALFDGANGSEPDGALSMDAAGNIYGATDAGGSNGEGTVFELSPASSMPPAQLAFAVQPSKALAGATINPAVEVSVEDANGIIVAGDNSTVTLTIGSGPPGATIGGTVSEATVNGVATFTDLSFDQTGAYTLTATDGDQTLTPANSSFAVAKVTLSGYYTLSVLSNANINANFGGIISDSAGNLYGTESSDPVDSGGSNGSFAVFEYSPSSGVLTTLGSATGGSGIVSFGSLLMDSAGNFYGTTLNYTGAADGTVFELAKGSGIITTLASFNGTDGSSPQAGVFEDSAGNLYGTTLKGGANNDGTVYEIVKGSGVITTLANAGANDAKGPDSELTMDSAGNLYGTDNSGGANGVGSVFELAKGSSMLSVLASFNTTDGSDPIGVVMDSAGNFYGATEYGGAAGDGTIFELKAGSGAIATIANFDGTDGSSLGSPLLMDSAGDLFGIAQSGGLTGAGTAFEVIRGSDAITTLTDFAGTGENTPYGALVRDNAGNIYGVAGPNTGGGENLFELTYSPATQVAFASTPATAVAGAYLSPAVTVNVEDPYGNVVVIDHSTVTLTITSGPSGAILGGAVSEAAVNGVATFSNLTLDQPGIYTLTATDGTRTAATSIDIVVFPAPKVGGLNTNFGYGGLALSNLGFTSTDGVVVVGGGESVIAGTLASAGNEVIGVARLNVDGSLDAAFGSNSNGATATPLPGNAEAAAEALLPNGDILVAGTDTTLVNGQSAGSQFALIEYTSTGALDTTFGNGAGYVLTGFSLTAGALSNDVAHAIAVGPDGTIYVGGSSDANGRGLDFAIAAFTPSGSPSPTFGDNGKVLLDILGGGDSIGALALEPKGELIAAGSAIDPSNGVSSVALAGFLPTGALDTKFGDRGKIVTSVGSVDDAASALAIDPKGNIIVGGYTGVGSAAAGTLSSDFLLLRCTSTGKLDKSFGNRGIVTTSFNQPAAITSLLIDRDGTIVASGKTAASLATLNISELDLAVAQYTAKGQLDKTFNGTGEATFDLSTVVVPESLTTSAGPRVQSAILQSTSAVPFDATGDLMTAFMQLTTSDQGVAAMTSGGELLAVGNSGGNTVEATIITMGLDLTASLMASLPKSIVTGGKGTASVNIAEIGTVLAAGTFTVELFVSSGPYLSIGQMPFESFPEKLKLAEGTDKSVNLEFAYPSSLSNGAYYLLATVATTGTTQDLNPANNTSASSLSVMIAQPFVQLAGSALTAPVFTGTKPAVVSFAIMNAGNEAASALSTVQFFASTDGKLTGATSLATTPLKLKLKSGTSGSFKVKLVLPATLPAGSYTLLALLDPSNVFDDPNAATNFIVSGNMFVVA